MRDNTVTAVAGDKLYIKTDSVFQYDYGLILKIEGIDLPETYRVHFGNTNSAAAKVVDGDANGVAIPDEYLRNGEDIHAYLYLQDPDVYGYSVLHIQIPVVDRAAIDREEITPVEHTFVEDALETVAEAVEQTEENVKKYPYINDEYYWMVYDAEQGEYVNTGVKAQGDNTFNLTIGDVATLAPGTPATASITWTAGGDARLNLGLPAGDPSAMVSIHDERSNLAVISVADGADNVRLDEIRVAILPIQAGSGTPSPRNIRRISGSDSLTLVHVAGEDSHTYNISFGEDPGTVYSGTYYPLTGQFLVDKLLVTKRCVDMNNSEVQPGWQDSGIKDIVGEDVDQTFTGQILNIGTSYSVDTTDGKDLLFLSYDQYGMRQTEWKNTEITVQICVELPNPIEYVLEPVALSTALGNNTYSVSTGKIAYMKYPCDTKKYIDHKIAETQALVLEN